MNKICTKCKQSKSLEEYYKDIRCKDGKTSECRSCHNLANAKYKKTDKGKAAIAKYNKSDKGKATIVKYNKSEERRLSNAKREKTDKCRLVRTIYRKTDKRKLVKTRYNKTDKGKATIARSGHNRRINLSNTINTLTDKEFNYIIFLQDNQCIGPDHEGSRYFTDKVKPQRDHIDPVSKGGNFTIYTVQALCKSCDSKKGTKYIDYRSDYHKEMIRNMI